MFYRKPQDTCSSAFELSIVRIGYRKLNLELRGKNETRIAERRADRSTGETRWERDAAWLEKVDESGAAVYETRQPASGSSAKSQRDPTPFRSFRSASRYAPTPFANARAGRPRPRPTPGPTPPSLRSDESAKAEGTSTRTRTPRPKSKSPKSSSPYFCLARAAKEREREREREKLVVPLLRGFSPPSSETRTRTPQALGGERRRRGDSPARWPRIANARERETNQPTDILCETRLKADTARSQAAALRQQRPKSSPTAFQRRQRRSMEEYAGNARADESESNWN